MKTRLKRALHAIAQGLIVGVLTFLLSWGILMAVNPTEMFDQSSFIAIATDSLSVYQVAWPLFPALALVVAILGYTIRFLGKRWRTFLAFCASVIIGAVPLVYGVVDSDSDYGILVLLFCGIVYLPFVAAAAASAGCVYGFILPSKRRRRTLR